MTRVHACTPASGADRRKASNLRMFAGRPARATNGLGAGFWRVFDHMRTHYGLTLSRFTLSRNGLALSDHTPSRTVRP